MAKKVRTVTPDQVRTIKLALSQLQGARDSLKYAEATVAVKAVRRALKSAEGALRHAEGVQMREYLESRRLAESRDRELVVVVKAEGGRG
jgi:hypothetical protein